MPWSQLVRLPAPGARTDAAHDRPGRRMKLIFPEVRTLDEDGLFEAYAPADGAPTLRVNFVTSLDGAVEAGGYSRGLSNKVDQRLLQLLRVHADAVLVGAGTLRHEGYGPMRLKPDLAVRRGPRGLSEQPTLVVVSAALDLDPTSRPFVEAPVRPVVLTHAAASDDRRRALSACGD